MNAILKNHPQRKINFNKRHIEETDERLFLERDFL